MFNYLSLFLILCNCLPFSLFFLWLVLTRFVFFFSFLYNSIQSNEYVHPLSLFFSLSLHFISFLYFLLLLLLFVYVYVEHTFVRVRHKAKAKLGFSLFAAATAAAVMCRRKLLIVVILPLFSSFSIYIFTKLQFFFLLHWI